jgi:phytoene dehydrogenase-like protein
MASVDSTVAHAARAVVVGAGLGGLSTAIRLRRMGMQVTLVERLDRVGGLCGTTVHDGLQYVIACNDFGRGLRKDLAELGIDHPFEATSTRVLMDGRAYTLPPNLPTIARLLPNAGAILRYVGGLRRARASRYARVGFLDALMDDGRIQGPIGDLLMLPAYLMGVSPDRFRIDALNDEFVHKYGYSNPIAPIGGPQKLADAFRNRFEQLGGQLLLGCEVLGIEPQGSRKCVRTTQGQLLAEVVVSTQPKAGHYPQQFEPGLPLSMLWLQLDARFALPRGIHTHVYYPRGIRQWYREIYGGHLPAEFGFHFFCSDLGEQNGLRTANLYFYLPRGREAEPQIQDAARSFIFSRLDALLPGITSRIRGSRMVTPEDFEQTHGFLPRVTPVITPAGFAKPGNYSAEDGLYYAGANAYPPGEHAGSAVRSSASVASLVAQQLSGGAHAH